MTDQLREALAEWDEWCYENGFEQDDNQVLADAARAWSEFPTDAQVEAAARIIYKSQRPGFGWPGGTGEEEIAKGWRVLARAALEAAHNTGKDEG